MAIKAHFSAGETTKRISALYQWDYGQQLEIESADLPTLVEVHFACPDMSEAIVRVCSVSNGIATVTIPNRCLEQSNPITAWVYEIHGTTGSTTKAVVIPVTARTRPCRSAEIPQDVSDRYTELISEVNEAVGKLKSGEIMVASAAKATSADRATSAGNASTAAHAEQATYATGAGAAKHLENTDGTKFGRSTLWKNPADEHGVFIGSGGTGRMPVDGFGSLKLSDANEYISGKWFVAKISKLYVYDTQYIVEYMTPARYFKTCPFCLMVDGEDYAFSQEIDGVTFSFYVLGSYLYYKSSSEGYVLHEIYEEL